MAEHGIAMVPGRTAKAAPVSEGRVAFLKLLLVCGIVAPLLYVAMLVFVPLGWEGYSSASRTVSELSAIGAPTRSVWYPLGVIYTLLVVAFGWGIWLSSRGNRRLRVVGGLLVACGVLGLFWPPMHLREVLAAGGGTLSDTLHIVWTAASNLLTLLAMGFAAAAFETRFRTYSVATMVLMIAFGAMTSVDAPRIQANLPTPWVGVWERLIIAVWMLWLVVLAVKLLRRPQIAAQRSRS
ncbi:MAG TPA: DUF998 domain-containing protein [Gemmatimonadales bacterium]